jgi:hypothetical protein
MQHRPALFCQVTASPLAGAERKRNGRLFRPGAVRGADFLSCLMFSTGLCFFVFIKINIDINFYEL